MTEHWSAVSEAGALAGLRLMVWVNDHLGRFAFNVLLIPVMGYFFLRRGEARRASVSYLQRVRQQHPGVLARRPIMWLSFRHFLSFGQSLLDKYVAWTEPPDSIQMDPEVSSIHAELIKPGNGVLLIGSHFGNIEYSRSLAAHYDHLVINILLHDQHAEKFAELMRDSVVQSHLNLIQVTDLDLELALELKEKVASGEWLIIAGDRVPLSGEGNTCPAEFFGAQARFPIGPYVLANLLRCPVYLLHCFRTQGGYRAELEHFGDELVPSRQGGRRKYDAEVQQFATALEAQVCREPLQWFNFYDFWRE